MYHLKLFLGSLIFKIGTQIIDFWLKIEWLNLQIFYVWVKSVPDSFSEICDSDTCDWLWDRYWSDMDAVSDLERERLSIRSDE